MNLTISCKASARITIPQTLKIEGHIKKKKVQEVKYHIKHQEMNLSIYFNALAGITTPQALKIEGLIKKKKVQTVKDHIEHQQQVLQLLKDNPTLVQNRRKQQEYQHRSEFFFDVGDWVFLRLQPYKQIRQAKKDNKLSPNYYGPYKVTQNIGTMEYKLELPTSS